MIPPRRVSTSDLIAQAIVRLIGWTLIYVGAFKIDWRAGVIALGIMLILPQGRG